MVFFSKGASRLAAVEAEVSTPYKHRMQTLRGARFRIEGKF
jgi:hypothetical protein